MTAFEGVREEVRALLSEVYEPEGVDIWMSSPHQWLGGERANDLIDRGEGARVLAAAERLVGGRVVSEGVREHPDGAVGSWRPGDYAWIVIREGRNPVIMQRGSQHNWFLPGSEKPYYAGDIWDILAAVRVVAAPTESEER